MASNVIDVKSSPFTDQKPGTSGLRKKVKVFQQENYTENFIQAIFDAHEVKPKFLVVGGDGRYYNEVAIQKLVPICAANGLERLLLTKNGLLSTPAASCLVRTKQADGAIILTASHNPGGPEADFGIKFNMKNGGPAPESFTSRIYNAACKITSYKTLVDVPSIDLEQLGTFQVGSMSVDVVDPVEDYLNFMGTIFDLDKISSFLQGKDAPRILVDAMNGVMGPYCKRILVDRLGAPIDSLINCQPMANFGGKHPDPNLTYAVELVDKLEKDSQIKLGIAFDGDGDRHMVLGEKAFFVTPGDSLAVLANSLKQIKHYGSNDGSIPGFARSFPTAPAVDRVAERLGVAIYETPTGWKFFGNLMDAKLIALCGEESFGAGANYIREKDGMFACLAWLNLMAHSGLSVVQILRQHWDDFGRDYFLRLDYEKVNEEKAQAMIKELDETLVIDRLKLIGKKVSFSEEETCTIVETGNFQYTDPVDQSVTRNQGLFMEFSNQSKIVLRLSGTGSSGATVRLYLMGYSKDKLDLEAQLFLSGLLQIALSTSRLEHYLGNDGPTVIT